jgi:mRNA-degrading endonuclease toxin of MazEF toxin-antitoxin module
MAPQFEISVFESESPLAKAFWLDQSGELKKEDGGRLTKGYVARRSFSYMSEFADFLLTLNGTHALAYGVSEHQEARVLSKKSQDSEKGGDRPIITRTRENFSWPRGEGIFLIDYDPPKDGPGLRREEVYQAIIDACPGLEDAPTILWHSASSFLYNGDKQLKGEGGYRIYIRVKDASDIPRAGKVLFKRLWLSGHGYIRITKNGGLVERAPVDAAVWQPERLDFAGGANCTPPIVQRRPAPVVLNDDFDSEAVDTRVAVPDLTEEEEAEYNGLVQAAKGRKKPQAKEIRKKWLENYLAHLSEEKREEIQTALDTHVLLPDFPLILSEDDSVVTVREVLANKEKYHKVFVRHPLEPDHQKTNLKVAQINTDGEPNVFTFARGNQVFHLRAMTPEEVFAGIDPPAETMEYPEPEGFTIDVDWLCDIDITTTPPREWILGNRYLRGYPTLTVAPGGGSKSTLVMTEMLALAHGVELTGEKLYTTGKVWVINSEDPKDEVHRRLWAICNFFGLPTKHPNVAVSGSEWKFCLAQETKEGRVRINYDHVDPIKKFIIAHGILIWSLDPLIRTHKVSENDNVGIDALARVIAEMCRDTNSACSAVHHTRKGNDIAGNMDSVRGASALVSAARIADTLTVMSEKEAKKLGLDDRKRKFYVRLDGAKSNLRPPAEDTKWFERIDVKLPNTDSIGVLKPHEFDYVEESPMDPLHRAIITNLAVEIPAGERWTINKAAQLLFDKYGCELKTEKGKTPSVRTLANHIMRIYQECPQIVGRSEIRYVRVKGAGKNGEHFLSSQWVADDHL